MKISDRLKTRYVYFYYEGMDCDCSAWGRPMEFNNIKEAKEYIEAANDACEGAISFSRMTKAEYNSESGYSRDLALEAYEDGRPYNIRF